MTREEAIEILKKHHMWTGEPQELIEVRKENEAIAMAISALSVNPCEDTISRIDVHKLLNDCTLGGWVEVEEKIFHQLVNELPSVQPVENKGESEIEKKARVTQLEGQYLDTGITQGIV